MPSPRYTPERIIQLLREAEVHQSQGLTIPVTCRKIGIHEQTFYKWRKDGLNLFAMGRETEV